MSKLKKTPAKVILAVQRHTDLMMQLTGAIRVKKTVSSENQCLFIREHSLDELIGMCKGANAMIEAVLFENNCYNGYRLVGDTTMMYGRDTFKPLLVGDPETQDWRRAYATFTPSPKL